MRRRERPVPKKLPPNRKRRESAPPKRSRTEPTRKTFGLSPRRGSTTARAGRPGRPGADGAQPKLPWNPRVRIGVVAFAFAAIGLVIVGRAYQLQIQRGDRYAQAAERQSGRTNRVTAKRGVIKDRHGAELAITVDVDSIFAEPRRIADPDAAATKLAKILELPEAKLAEKLKSKRAFRYLRRRVGPDVAAKVRELGIEGIGIRPEPKRFYSNRDLAAHVLGFTNTEGQGRAGIERTFDATLRGKSYELPGLRDALGNSVFSQGFVPQAVLEGDDVVLTMDRHIQHVAEVELERAVKDNGGDAGMVIVLQPRTGDVLALASYPKFNPNNLRDSGSDEHLNRVVSQVYEPGSTMKLVTIAASLDEGVIEPNDTVDCEGGQWKVGRRTIRDANHKYGVLSIADVLKLSSNICSAKIGMELGRERLHKWLYKFGFGAKSGIELPGEVRGLIRPHDRWRDIALANISFGQGLSVTALQVAQAAATIANGGRRVSPRIVQSVTDKAGVVRPTERPEPVRVLSEKTATALTKMMLEVTQSGGTAPQAAIPGFNVAGKTGTSQKIDEVTKAYSHSLYVASFVGFVPAERPEVVVLVVVDQPEKSIYGGTVAAPAFRRIATAALASLEIYPDDPAARAAFLADAGKTTPLPAPVVARAAIEKALGIETGLSPHARALLGLAPEPVVRAAAETDAEPTRTSPTGWDDGADESIQADEEKFRMPNFAGLSPREVINRSRDVGCDLVLSGTGRVVKQSPRAGTVLRHGARCELMLAPKG